MPLQPMSKIQKKKKKTEWKLKQKVTVQISKVALKEKLIYKCQMRLYCFVQEMWQIKNTFHFHLQKKTLSSDTVEVNRGSGDFYGKP